VEILSHDHEVVTIINAILKSAHTGQRGDGKTFLLPIFAALSRIKIMERGEAVLGPSAG
jgi:nitrogen regulatory protein PII